MLGPLLARLRRRRTTETIQLVDSWPVTQEITRYSIELITLARDYRNEADALELIRTTVAESRPALNRATLIYLAQVLAVTYSAEDIQVWAQRLSERGAL